MFNTKRIKALGERIEDIKESINQRIEYWSEELIELKKDVLFIRHFVDKNYAIPCSTCKCLIRKEDSIKGKSEIVEKHFGLDFKGNETIVEEIQRHYYCHKCKPKKL